jgi:hypothetical protein
MTGSSSRPTASSKQQAIAALVDVLPTSAGPRPQACCSLAAGIIADHVRNAMDEILDQNLAEEPAEPSPSSE